MNGISSRSRILKTFAALVLVSLFFAILGVVSTWQDTKAEETLSRLGSSGSEVRQIQTKLKSWGYYTGTVDGAYGAKTKSAVVYFQKKNGLSADGVAGSATLRALGISSGSTSGGYGRYSSSDYNLLARVISAEARGEPYVGQVAVGAVVLNRVEHPSFPNTVAGVIYQPGAFTCLTDGQFNQPIASSAYRAAQDAINGWDPSSGAIYYYNPATATSKWIWSRPVLLTIGKHKFCK
jgi:N-acetylmuramoyl-L-alanine amidase